MKGISNTMFLILLASLSVSITYVMYVFLTGTVSSASQAGTQISDNALSSLSSCIRIESVSGSRAFVRNCGEGYLTSSTLGMYIGETPLGFSMIPASIAEGETAIVTLYDLSSVSAGTHMLRATGPKASGEILVEAYGSPISLRILD